MARKKLANAADDDAADGSLAPRRNSKVGSRESRSRESFHLLRPTTN